MFLPFLVDTPYWYTDSREVRVVVKVPPDTEGSRRRILTRILFVIV